MIIDYLDIKSVFEINTKLSLSVITDATSSSSKTVVKQDELVYDGSNIKIGKKFECNQAVVEIRTTEGIH